MADKQKVAYQDDDYGIEVFVKKDDAVKPKEEAKQETKQETKEEAKSGPAKPVPE